MLLKLKSHLARRLAVLAATFAVTCTFATLAAAQEQPPPKWELFGGYSVFDPGASIHGELPGALLPLSSQLEWNPRGAGASVTYNFDKWIGLTLDTSTHWGSGETTLAKRIDDAAFSNLSFGPKITWDYVQTNDISRLSKDNRNVLTEADRPVNIVTKLIRDSGTDHRSRDRATSPNA